MCGLVEIRMEMCLLEMGVQLMITTYNVCPYNECRPMLVFLVVSVVPDLVSLSRGSSSKPCPADLSKAQDVPSIVL